MDNWANPIFEILTQKQVNMKIWNFKINVDKKFCVV